MKLMTLSLVAVFFTFMAHASGSRPPITPVILKEIATLRIECDMPNGRRTKSYWQGPYAAIENNRLTYAICFMPSPVQFSCFELSNGSINNYQKGVILESSNMSSSMKESISIDFLNHSVHMHSWGAYGGWPLGRRVHYDQKAELSNCTIE